MPDLNSGDTIEIEALACQHPSLAPIAESCQQATNRFRTAWLAIVCLIVCLVMPSSATYAEQKSGETKYLLFQVFVADPSSAAFPPQGEIGTTVQDIISHIGTTGDLHQKLGFAVGPLSFNQSDEEIRRLIRQSFAIAREKNVAVAFHVDDQMFWDKRKDLLNDKSNIEWLDWKGTPCTGARLDWGPKPFKAPAQMCFNSPAIQAAVKNRAHLIGAEIKRETDALKLAGKEELFAGIIAGWETRIARDFDTNQCVGFHALSNKGFNAKKTSAQCDAQLVSIVKEFIDLWTRELAQAGTKSEKIYSHIAFTSQGIDSPGALPYAQQVGFATPEVAFNKHCRPGFSTYPMEDELGAIQSEVAKRGNAPWISAEGTNVVPNGMPGEATMETYLGKMFNHGAVMVNVFSWGIGGAAEKNNLFRRATENNEAISAYRKFLTGKVLHEQQRSSNVFSAKKLQQKIQTIQREGPIWVQKTRRGDLIQPLMIKLDGFVKGNKFQDADRVADEILNLIIAK